MRTTRVLGQENRKTGNFLNLMFHFHGEAHTVSTDKGQIFAFEEGGSLDDFIKIQIR